jgi:glucose-6-phosphate isomerase
MFYEHDVSGAVAKSAGFGLKEADLAALLKRADGALEGLRSMHRVRSLPLLTLPREREDLEEIEEVSRHLLDGALDIFLLGVGGSSLGAQALAQIAGFGVPGNEALATGPRIHFFDNLDANTMAKSLAGVDLTSARFLAVSKSGTTAETLMQTLVVLNALKGAGLGGDLKKHFAVITVSEASPLRQLAEDNDFPILVHDSKVGGRYSVLSNVGLVPAVLFGLDPVKIREGAESVLAPILNGAAASSSAPALGAALAVGLAEQCSVKTNVVLSYSDRLKRFGDWFAQLWAESLGKDGKGTLAYGAMGPVDQHSQLQLYLDGPNDKFHTVIMTKCAGKGPKVSAGSVGDERLSYIAGKTIGDLVDAEQRATADTLIGNKRPTRVIRIADVCEETLGALLMHFMLETIIAGHLTGVDPFDQPAVEEGKLLARQYLGEL